MTLNWNCSFWEILKSFLRYHQTYYQMAFRLWRDGLPLDFAHVMAIEGQMKRNEAYCLYKLAESASSEGVIVEIGSYRGFSTIALARGSLRGAKIPVYAIDPHEPYSRHRQGEEYGLQDGKAFCRNILFSGVAGLVHPINLFSAEAVTGWTKPISLLWIDGNHEYEAVKTDFRLWSPFVVHGGYVSFHDSSDPSGGPYRVLQEALASGHFELTQQIKSVSVLRKS